jgi:hypothetical protein
MIKIILLSAMVTLSLVGSVRAQQQNYYDSSGRYLGQSQAYGNQQNYYDSSGRYMGQSQTNGNQTNYYGSSGQYQGQGQGY